jgi:MFS family permease
MSDIEKADRLGRKRARLLVIMGLLLPLLHFAYLNQPHGLPPHRLFLWSFVVLTVLFALTTGGGFGFGRKVRHLVNDESARANRDMAVRLGFAVAVLSGLAVRITADSQPVTGQLAAQIIITAGLTAASICYGVLEWRGHRLG